MKEIIPPATIGILGGGQLGMMMAEEAIALGYRVITYDPNPSASASRISHQHFVGSFNDRQAILEFASHCDVVTYEFENVNQKIMHELERTTHLPQGAYALEIASHRVKEIKHAQHLGLRVADYTVVFNKEDLFRHAEQFGFPIVLKTLTGGYDGKGQYRFYSLSELENFSEKTEGIAQKWIDFNLEVSVVCVRAVDGVFCFEPIENEHEHGILRQSIQPARINAALSIALKEQTTMMVESLNYYGTFAVEYFIEGDKIYFNEMACRPHNSGHCTIETYTKSQFKAHVEAILYKKIRPIEMIKPGVMINILGDEVERLPNFSLASESSYHDYYKTIRHQRKMGHVTFIDDSIDKALMKSQNLRRRIKPNE